MINIETLSDFLPFKIKVSKGSAQQKGQGLERSTVFMERARDARPQHHCQHSLGHSCWETMTAQQAIISNDQHDIFDLSSKHLQKGVNG